MRGRPLSERLTKLAKGVFLGLTRDAGDNVPGEAANDDRLVGGEVHRANDVANDGRECVSVVEAEGCHPVALAAKIYRRR